jgi:hypothetical protein
LNFWKLLILQFLNFFTNMLKQLRNQYSQVPTLSHHVHKRIISFVSWRDIVEERCELIVWHLWICKTKTPHTHECSVVLLLSSDTCRCVTVASHIVSFRDVVQSYVTRSVHVDLCISCTNDIRSGCWNSTSFQVLHELLPWDFSLILRVVLWEE